VVDKCPVKVAAFRNGPVKVGAFRKGPVKVAAFVKVRSKLARFVCVRSALSACSGSLDVEFTVSNNAHLRASAFAHCASADMSEGRHGFYHERRSVSGAVAREFKFISESGAPST
jgi:hypothetical protein